MKKSPQAWLLLSLILVLFLIAGIWLLPDPLKKYPPFVSDSPSPTGVKGIYTYLKNNNAQTGMWNQGNTIPSLSIGKQTMLMVQPYQGLGASLEKHWMKWMEEGNRIWLMAEDPEGMFQIETTLKESYDKEKVRKVTGSFAGNGEYLATIDSNARLQAQEKDRILLQDEEGVVALSRSFGKGELLVTVTPEWLQNGKILKHNHYALIAPFLHEIGRDVVWFNETIHGYKSKGAFIKAYPKWFLMIFLQVVLVAIFFIWWKGKRFGPIEIPRAARVRFHDERIRAMAAWYERSGFYQEALSIQQTYIRKLLQEKWYIPESTDLSAMLSLVSSRLAPEQWNRWKKVWEQGQRALERKNCSPREFLYLSQQFDRIRKEIENE